MFSRVWRLKVPILEAKNISKTFSEDGRTRKVLQDISLTIEKGARVAILGESGAGKTTLARVLRGLIEPDSGCIYFKNKPSKQYSSVELARQFQLLSQDAFLAFHPTRPVSDLFFKAADLHFKEMPPNERKELIYRTWEIARTELGLSETIFKSLPSRLSGGERQRVAIIRSVFLRPELIIFDEPTSSLDRLTALATMNYLNDVIKKNACAALFISHDLSLLLEFTEQIIIIYNGRIIEEAKVSEILEHPLHPYTRLLLASEDLWKGDQFLDVEDITNIPTEGCVFWPGCNRNQEICKRAVPSLRGLGHRVACFLY